MTQKVVKEFLETPGTGDIAIEFSDGTTLTYNRSNVVVQDVNDSDVLSVSTYNGKLKYSDVQRVSTVTWEELQNIPDIGKSYFVSDIGADLVKCRNNGFGWKPIESFQFQPILSEYTHVDTSTAVGVPWQITIPKGFLHFGYIVVTPVITFPSSSTTKKIELKVNGTSLFSKSRTTSTHEAPMIIVNARDSAVLNYPYYTNSVPISGGTGFSNLNNMNIDNSTTDIEIKLETSFTTSGTGTESIVTRFLRAEFKPF